MFFMLSFIIIYQKKGKSVKIKKIFKIFIGITSLFFISSCYKNHLYVQVEKLDRDFLASTHVDTPDYRQEKPPHGRRIIISWNFPKNLYEKDLFINLRVRFWDNTEALRVYNLHRKLGTKDFYFEGKKILTYQVEIVSKDKEVIEVWRHQFWTKLIDVDRDGN